MDASTREMSALKGVKNLGIGAAGEFLFEPGVVNLGIGEFLVDPDPPDKISSSLSRRECLNIE